MKTLSLDVWILLLSQITVISSRGRFSKWSPWSPCSRSCDGGISTRERTCRETKCEGITHEDKICNIQPCPANVMTLGSDFRDQQCSLYNDVPYETQLYKWEAAPEDKLEPAEICQLHCRAAQNPGIIAKMDRQAVDGTRCRTNSLDICIRGECRNVGCDLKLDSDLKVDQCGICGGNGTQCSTIRFVWEETPLSRCSVPCGGGYMMAHCVCRNNETKAVVHDDLCDKAKRPKSRMAPCSNRACPARWEVTDWSECSKSCGGGVKTRDVACITDKDGKKIKVPKEKCPNLEPPEKEGCNMEECPQWYTGIWSECSVRCGRRGLQHRNVICRNVRGFPSRACGLAQKPASSQPCRGPGYDKPDCREEEDGARWKKSQDGTAGQSLTGWKKLQQTRLDLPGQVLDNQTRVSPTPELSSPSPEVGHSPLLPQKLIDSVPPEVTTEASFIVEDWEPCSALCGEGIRRRKVECKIFLEFSKTIAVLPDHKCPGPKPPETEICFAGLCDFVGRGTQTSSPKKTSDIQSDHGLEQVEHPLPALALKIGHKITYRWKEAGFTACSESCLGGIQETKILCVDQALDAPVSPVNCKLSERPEVRVQTCNDHPCPPRWNVSDFSHCSKSCGGGIQTRTVTCIQEVRHGQNNILRVDDSFCPQPPPITQQFCNVIDCPIKWNTSPWTKCSKKCGPGTMYQKVRCQQLLALGEIANKPEDECPRPRPQSEKTCYERACTSYDYEPSRKIFSEAADEAAIDDRNKKKHLLPTIKANFYQAFIQEPDKKTVKLKVGGHATIYEGSKVKIACPVKKFNKSLLKWYKDDQMVERGGPRRGRGKRSHKRVFVTKKGSLRIKSISYADAGTYTCMAKQATASIDIEVKKPFGTENEILNTQDFYDPLRAINKYNKEESAGDSTSHTANQVYSQNNVVKEDEEDGGLYGVVKHMTDQPYSFDEFSYGRISPPAPSPTTPRPLESSGDEEQWKIFPRRNYEDRQMVFPTPESTTKTDGYMRFNTVNSDKSEDEPKLKGGRWPISRPRDDVSGIKYSDEEYFELGSSNTFWDDLDDLDSYPKGAKEDDQTDNEINPFEHTSVSLSSSSDSRANQSQFVSQLLIVFCLVLGQSLTIMNQKRHLDNNPEDEPSTKGPQWVQREQVPIHMDQDPAIPMDEPEEENETEDSHPVKLDWQIGDWSKCSQTCGGGGTQMRQIDCVVIMSDNGSEVIPSSLCLDAGLPEPAANQSCGQQVCPQWITQQWNKCRDAECVARNTALQTRDVFCGIQDSSAPALEDNYCEAILRPTSSRQCFTRKCKTTWIASDWTECSQSCGEGEQMREVLCIWKKHNPGKGVDCSTSNPCQSWTVLKGRSISESFCTDLKQPKTSRRCNPMTCPIESKTSGTGPTGTPSKSCDDVSKYCGLVQSFRMCHIQKYQVQCCRTCTISITV